MQQSPSPPWPFSRADSFSPWLCPPQLIAPISQSSGLDPLVQGLSAFLLGVCYEFNREPGEITRATLHPILHGRIGPDQFVSRMARLREDPRFKAVGPETDDEDEDELGPGGQAEREEVWFDWSFVEFWKGNYCQSSPALVLGPECARSIDGVLN